MAKIELQLNATVYNYHNRIERREGADSSELVPSSGTSKFYEVYARMAAYNSALVLCRCSNHGRWAGCCAQLSRWLRRGTCVGRLSAGVGPRGLSQPSMLMERLSRFLS